MNVMAIQLFKYPTSNSSLSLRVARGHFATSHSHINYYIDLTMTKHRLSEAREGFGGDGKPSTAMAVAKVSASKRKVLPGAAIDAHGVGMIRDLCRPGSRQQTGNAKQCVWP